MAGLTEQQRRELQEQDQENSASRRQRDAAAAQSEKAEKHPFARGFMKGAFTAITGFVTVNQRMAAKNQQQDARRQIEHKDFKDGKDRDDGLSY